MKCPNCEAENPATRTFCQRCSEPLKPSSVRPVLSPDEPGDEQLRAQLATAAAELEKLRIAHTALERERQQLNGQTSDLVKERDALRQREGELAGAVAEAGREAAGLRSRIGELDERIRGLEKSQGPSVLNGSGNRGFGWRTAGLIAAALIVGGVLGYFASTGRGRSVPIAVVEQERATFESQLAAAGQREATLREQMENAKRGESPAAALAKREQAIKSREAEVERLTAQVNEKQTAIERERSLLDKERQGFEATRRAAEASKPPPAAAPPGALGQNAFLSWRAPAPPTTAISISIQGGRANFGSVTSAPQPAGTCQVAMRSRGVEKVSVRVEPGPKNNWAQAYFQVYPPAANRPGTQGELAVVEFYCRG